MESAHEVRTTGITLSNSNFVNSYLKEKIRINLEQIKAPDVTWKHAPGFSLAKIKTMFIIPDFERKVSTAHVNRILISILNNEFFDNIIRVVPAADGKYLVIDGQHRLSALWKAYNTFGLQKYDLLLGIYKNEDDARLIYQKINSGQKLKIIEMMKAMDDGRLPYFIQLKSHCVHDEIIDKLTYYDVLCGIVAGRSADPSLKSVRVSELFETINSVTDDEISSIKKLLNFMYELHPHTNSNIYFSTIFRTICNVHMQYGLEKHEVLKVTNMIQNNNKYTTNMVRKREVIDDMHEHVVRYLLNIRKKQ